MLSPKQDFMLNRGDPWNRPDGKVGRDASLHCLL